MKRYDSPRTITNITIRTARAREIADGMGLVLCSVVLCCDVL